MMYFTADLHLGHSNIIGACERPFDTVERMNAALIANINERVGARDSLYVLGDFSYRTTVEEASRLRRRIRCENVHLVRGNHDKHWADTPHADAFASEQDYLEIKAGYAQGHKLVMSHYPMLSWNGRWRASIMLHGHIHSRGAAYNERNRAAGILRYDVGVDANGYRPVSRDEILSFFAGVEPVRGAFELDIEVNE